MSYFSVMMNGVLESESEVRFKEHGTESIEVIDNGSGIAPEDYDALGKCKSHVSYLDFP